MFRKLLVLCAFVSGAALLVACGGDDDDNGSSSGSGGSTAVEIRDFAYEPNRLTASSGQAITLELKNEGPQPHTFTIQGVVDSQRVDAGQSKTINFTPAQAGSLTFFCTIHGQAVMSGTLTVN